MALQDELYIGLMSGTGVDGIDVAVVDFTGSNPKLVCSRLHSISTDLKKRISEISVVKEITDKNTDTLELAAELDILMGEVFAEAVNQLLHNSEIDKKQIKAIGSHGQTIRHRPYGRTPFSLQIGDPNTIAHKTGITTVADFRRMDVAAGGQGAPLTPAFHNAIFRSEKENRIILNLGGIANITVLDKRLELPVIGFDTGTANTLLDAWYNNQHPNSKVDYDKDAHFASEGKINQSLLKRLLDDPYFRLPFPKSTGREYFSMDWLNKNLQQMERKIKPQDIQRTTLQLTVDTIVDAINQLSMDNYQLLVCGGGMHNPLIMQLLSELLNKPVIKTDAIGVSGDYLEAMTFAWLARQRILKLTGNLPSVTGATEEKILGAVYTA